MLFEKSPAGLKEEKSKFMFLYLFAKMGSDDKITAKDLSAFIPLLNEVLEDINEDFLQLVKKKISIEGANALLLGIPARELIELIKLIPDEEE